MTEPTELDRSRRYLVPVARSPLPDEPDLVHLSVYEWLPGFDAWATTGSLCGSPTRQGALPEGADVTCNGCLTYRPKYERYLAPGYRPEDDDPDVLRKRLEDAHVRMVELARQVGDLQGDADSLRTVEDLLSQWAPDLRRAFPVLFRKLDYLLTLSSPDVEDGR